MLLKIYFGDNPLFLCDQIDQEVGKLIHRDDAIFIDELSTPAVNSIIHEMSKKSVHAGVFYNDNLEKLRKAIFKKFYIILAGGGIVKNERNELLFIFRRDKWDLPKGKKDNGETVEHCAIREVMEETGLKYVDLNSPLTITYHTYNENGKFCLKESHWFTMDTSGNQELIPQSEEQITELTWFSPSSLSKVRNNTYPSVLDVLSAAGYSGK
ncbi:MAG TPA: NUDIX domain-containing protein [Puia sp.]|nr:NUDIX domain-containing protein [Puia sp.]